MPYSEKKNKKDKSTKKLLVRLSLATLVAAFPSKIFAQNLNCFDSLIFGEIIPCGAAGTVTVNPDNTTGSTCVTVGGPQSRARCIATQSFPFRPIQISITAGAFSVSNGTTSMNVNGFNIITNAGGCCTTITAPFVSIPIGATLNVGGSQNDGTYTGTFGISAILQ